MDDDRRRKLKLLRNRRNAERERWYRAFESGVAKAMMRSHICTRLDDTLADQISSWLLNTTAQIAEVTFETSELGRADWLASARDLLTATKEPLFIVLSRPGAPYIGAICGHDAVIDILEEVLDREEGIIVLCPCAPDGFHFELSGDASRRDFSIAAWGMAVPILNCHVQSMTSTWHAVPGDCR